MIPNSPVANEVIKLPRLPHPAQPAVPPPSAHAKLPALTIRRPFAQLLIAGIKTRENRGWSTTARGWFICHGGKAWAPGVLDLLVEHDIDVPDEHPTGYLGVVYLGGIHVDTACTAICSPWCIRGQFHWECPRAIPFPEPIPGGGRQGWFTPPDHVQDAAHELLAAAA